MVTANRHQAGTERIRWRLVVGFVASLGFAIAIEPASAQHLWSTEVAVANVTAGYLGYDYSVQGWNVQFGAQRTRRWTLVGEFDAEREHLNHRGWAGLGGGRFGWRPAPRVSPFFQILAGGQFETGVGDRQDTISSLAIQPGVGMTVRITPRLGVRIQSDLRFGLSSDVSGLSRIAVGGVFRLRNGTRGMDDNRRVGRARASAQTHSHRPVLSPTMFGGAVMSAFSDVPTRPSAAEVPDFSRLALRPGDLVRVTNSGGVVWSGHVTSVSRSSLVVDGRSVVPGPDLAITQIGDPIRNGLLTGIGVGAALGATGADQTKAQRIGTMVVWSAFFGGVGALIDWAHRNETVRYDTRPGARRSVRFAPEVTSSGMGFRVVATF